MTITASIKVDEERTWAAMSGIPGSNGGCILIPINQIGDFSNIAIGNVVLQYISFAKELEIEERADRILVQDVIANEETLDFLSSATLYEDKNKTIHEACEYIREGLAKLEKQRKAKKYRKQVRKELQKNYDKLFVAVGRRDGFKCKYCGSTDDLTLDHVIAVFNGGKNGIDNLQILCQSCNSKKGVK